MGYDIKNHSIFFPAFVTSIPATFGTGLFGSVFSAMCYDEYKIRKK